MYDRVLLPTDGSRESRRAIDLAIDTASHYDATLDALYVVDTHTQAARVSPGMVRERLATRGQEALSHVTECAEAAGVETSETILEADSPARAILEYTDAHGSDLIVMGTHGRTGFDRVLLGSVAERVVRLASVPVLTVGMVGDVTEEQ